MQDPHDITGSMFIDFEERVEELAGAFLPVATEERALLEPNAEVKTAGRRIV